MDKDFSGRLYVSNIDAWKNGLERFKLSERELEVKTIENGIILPARELSKKVYEGGVCDNDFNFVAGHHRVKDIGGWGSVISSYTVDRSDIKRSDEDVIFAGCFIQHFGHFFMECLGRLWYVLQHPEVQSKIVFINTIGKSFRQVYFFEMMDIPKERYSVVSEPTQFRSITIPEESYSLYECTKEYLIPYQYIRKKLEPGTVQKLYLTRRQFDAAQTQHARCFNEQYFESWFSSRGFTIIAPEKLPIAEQISLVSGADEIAATLGTLSHFALFCKPGTKFIMLLRKGDSIPELQFLVNRMADIDWKVVDVSKNFLYTQWGLGACLLGSTQHWKQFVADYFNEQIDTDDDQDYLDDNLKEYVDYWCTKYSQTIRLPSSLKELCNRVIDLEHELDKGRPLLFIEAHVSKKGWLPRTLENHVGGFLDEQLCIQAIKIYFSKPFSDIRYAVYYPKEGWSEEASNGNMAGTTGMGKAIMGVKIHLDGSVSEQFDILYRMHNYKNEWSPWAKNGEPLISKGAKSNAIQIK